MTPKSTVKVIDYYSDTIVVGTEVPNTNRLKFGTSALPYIYFFPRAHIATILVVKDDVCKPSFEHRMCQFKELVLFYLLSIL